MFGDYTCYTDNNDITSVYTTVDTLGNPIQDSRYGSAGNLYRLNCSLPDPVPANGIVPGLSVAMDLNVALHFEARWAPPHDCLRVYCWAPPLSLCVSGRQPDHSR